MREEQEHYRKTGEYKSLLLSRFPMIFDAHMTHNKPTEEMFFKRALDSLLSLDPRREKILLQSLSFSISRDTESSINNFLPISHLIPSI
jgi:hypothetical protein